MYIQKYYRLHIIFSFLILYGHAMHGMYGWFFNTTDNSVHADYADIIKNNPFRACSNGAAFESCLEDFGFTDAHIAVIKESGKAGLKQVLQDPQLNNKLSIYHINELCNYLHCAEEHDGQGLPLIPKVPPVEWSLEGYENLAQSLSQSARLTKLPDNRKIIAVLPPLFFLNHLRNLHVDQVLINQIKANGLNNDYVQQIYTEIKKSEETSDIYECVVKILTNCGYINRAQWGDGLLSLGSISARKFEAIMQSMGGADNVPNVAALKQSTQGNVIQLLKQIKNDFMPQAQSEDELLKARAEEIITLADQLICAHNLLEEEKKKSGPAQIDAQEQSQQQKPLVDDEPNVVPKLNRLTLRKVLLIGACVGCVTSIAVAGYKLVKYIHAQYRKSQRKNH